MIFADLDWNPCPYFLSKVRFNRMNLNKDAKEILAAGNWESILQMVTDSIFQKLEAERSTIKLLKIFSDKLGLDVDQSKIDAANGAANERERMLWIISRHGFVP